MGAEGTNTPDRLEDAVVERLRALLGLGPPTLRRADVALATGIPSERSVRWWRAMGFPEVGDEAVAFGPAEIEILRRIDSFVDASVLTEDDVLRLARTMGVALSRVTDAQVELLAAAIRVELSGAHPPEHQDDVLPAAIEAMGEAVTYLWTHHLLAALTRALVREDGAVDQAVGFADMTGFSRLSRSLGTGAIARLIDAFEAMLSSPMTVAIALIVGGVVILLTWVTLAGKSFAWASGHSYGLAALGVVLLVLAVLAEGKLLNRFLIVSNMRLEDPSNIITGNQRVVRPRLSDARFFFEQDRKAGLSSRVGKLDSVVYHNKLGSLGDRVQRLDAVARAVAVRLGADDAQAGQAARLCKADLVTDMVGEFPELQGIMGRYYAQHDGLNADVADAIEDHYKPRFAGDTLPRGLVGTVVALADKLETLVGMFGIGQIPTGDRDPFALRRHALGIVDVLHVIDHLSEDNTVEILLALRAEGLPIHLHRLQTNSSFPSWRRQFLRFVRNYWSSRSCFRWSYRRHP